jgi:release factor glutamine methyltransferase
MGTGTPHRAMIAAGATIGALQAALPLDPLENRILLCHALGVSRVSLITQSDRTLTAEEAARLSALVERRKFGEPIAYIVGQREFFGLPFQVNDSVLIPRPDTELLVELVLERLPQQGRLLDMGTGSGAIAVAAAHTRRDADVTALDFSGAALDVARANANAHDVNVRLLRSDWFSNLGAEQFDVIASNPPYIAAGDSHLTRGDLRFEPNMALTDQADGLSALRTIIKGAPAHLRPGGWLLLEHGYDQATQVRELLEGHGYTDVQSWRDLACIDRASGGRLPAKNA